MMLGNILQGAAARLRPLAVPALMPSAITDGFLTRSMKVMSSLKKRCDQCRLVKRGKLTYIYCPANGKHKARNGPKRRKNQV